VEPIAVTELKQWVYCPRIVYYHRVLGTAGKQTFKMQEARAAQDVVEELERRRGLAKYGLAGARRRFDVWMRDARLGLAGKADLLLEAADEVGVVDFKLTSGEPGENHVVQLGAYSMLAEAACGLQARQAFMYRIPDGRLFPIAVTDELRARVLGAVREIRRVEETQWYPEMTPVRGRCAECEFANYCADVW
jgi:CRISPR-associated exonuclease Cas4